MANLPTVPPGHFRLLGMEADPTAPEGYEVPMVGDVITMMGRTYRVVSVDPSKDHPNRYDVLLEAQR